MPLRALRSSVIVACVIAVGACGPAPGAPSPPGPPVPTVFQTTVRAVSAVNRELVLPQVVVTLEDGRELQTDGAGMAVIQVGSPAAVSVRLRHPSFVERETSVRIPDDRVVDLSLIPSTHDLTAFEEFSPRLAGLQRWTRNPRLLVLTHAVDFSAATLGFREFPVIDRPISAVQLDCLAAGIAASLAEMSGGQLSWDSVAIGPVDPGTRFRTDETPEGTIAVLPSVSLGASGRGTGYVGATPFVLTRGAVWMSAESANFCLTSLLYRHELGHALGYLHVTRTLSIMGFPGLPPALTEFDRQSIAILFQRPPGNRSPDRDPPGVPARVRP